MSEGNEGMLGRKIAENLWPPEIGTLARTCTRAIFKETLGAPLLLVRLDDPEGELGLALSESSTVGGQRLESMVGETVVGVFADTARIKAGGDAPRAPLGRLEIQRRLLRTVHFALPLHKRPGANNLCSGRIMVGRARPNDVVLRDVSVSKFHAWFERDDHGILYVRDANSTNSTFVNGVALPRSGHAPLNSGDELRFGDVRALLCPPEVLWDAMMTGQAVSSRPTKQAP